MIVTDDCVRAFVEKKIGEPVWPPFTMIGLERDGEIVAGAVFNDHRPNKRIEVTLAAERGAITREFLRALGHYVCDKCNCYCATFTTEQTFVAEMVIRLGGQLDCKREISPGKYEYLLSIKRQNWKF